MRKLIIATATSLAVLAGLALAAAADSPAWCC